jgi:hypothetical protein
MSLENCKQCGKIYLMDRLLYCEACRQEQEQLFYRVRDYVKQNPNCTLLDVHIQTGIPIAKILEIQKEMKIL